MSGKDTADTPVSLYIHIPFCVRKCAYCDFLSGPSDEGAREQYLAALLEEIRSAGSIAGKDGREVDTVFVGGGTPTVLTTGQLERLMDGIRASFRVRRDAEITTECNPGTADPEKLRALREMGFTRLSIGVQSFKERDLALLGRIHTAKEAVSCYESARRAGFANINLDLISALPGQTLRDWMENLEEAAALAPEHISAYSLILEDGTPLKRRYEAGALPPFPDEDEDRRMYHDTKRFLETYGYTRYEISNYARDGFACRHNVGYWTGHEYLGLGLGAAGLYRHTRMTNTRDMETYLAAFTPGGDGAGKAPGTQDGGEKSEKKEGENHRAFDIAGLRGGTKEYEALTPEDEMSEFMILGLRMMRGVRPAEFRDRFGKELRAVFGEAIRRHEQEGLLEEQSGWLRLTERGIDISNYVLCDFMPD